MKMFLVLFSVIFASSSFAFANDADKEPLVLKGTLEIPVKPTAEHPDLHIPSEIRVHTMTDAKVMITHDETAIFSVSLEAVSQAKNAAGLEKLVNSAKLKFRDDGTLDIDAKTSGFEHCSYNLTNGVYEKVGGTCLIQITVNLPVGLDIPVSYSR